MTTTVPLARITRDPEAWPRAQLDDERVNDFLELYRESGLLALPPIAVIERADDYLLADGWHRHEALTRLGVEEVPVELVNAQGRDPVRLAYEIGLRSSATASKSLTRAEKQAAVQRLTVEGGRTDQQIADLVGVARTTVGRIRAREGAMHTLTWTPTTVGFASSHEQRAPAQAAGIDGDTSPEADDEEYVPIADEIANRIVGDLWELWKVRGVTDRYYGRLPRNLTDALRAAYDQGDALLWARRVAAWATDAVERLEQEAGDA